MFERVVRLAVDKNADGSHTFSAKVRTPIDVTPQSKVLPASFSSFMHDLSDRFIAALTHATTECKDITKQFPEAHPTLLVSLKNLAEEKSKPKFASEMKMDVKDDYSSLSMGSQPPEEFKNLLEMV